MKSIESVDAVHLVNPIQLRSMERIVRAVDGHQIRVDDDCVIITAKGKTAPVIVPMSNVVAIVPRPFAKEASKK